MNKLYQNKDLNCGFIILCLNHNPRLVLNTVRSISDKCGKLPSICCVSDDFRKEEISEIGSICPVKMGQKTVSSLINVGMKNAPADWNFIVVAGTILRKDMHIRFSRFVEKDTDILFPIAEGKYNFIDATINGLFMHKDMFKRVGDWDTNTNLELCKTLWAGYAVEKGCKFKAIANMKIC